MKLNSKFYQLLIFATITIIQLTNAAGIKKNFRMRNIQKSQEINNDFDFNDDNDSMDATFAKLEVDILKCPDGCVCQYAHFMDLPISRWISYMQQRQPEKPSMDKDSEEDNFIIENDNEALHDGDESFLTNPLMKQATCILQEDKNEVELVNNLPHDLEALILLYTGIGRNKTINTSTLKQLNQLTTLEIRGTQDRSLRVVFDEPLSFIQHANFESITLLGSELFKRPKNPVHPSDSFNYKPKMEFFSNSYETTSNSNLNSTAYMHNGLNKLDFESPIDEVEILPYNIYVKEIKKSRMPSFYGWEHLEVLRIHECKLNELYWEMFDGLEALQHLSLERNEIIAVPDFALFGAMHIKTLSLAHNRIVDLRYRSLAGLLELEMLDLSDNRLGKLSELSFPPFPSLAHVDFRQNPIRYIFPATFWVMNSTRTMLFDSNEASLELWPNEPFDKLKYLESLKLENISVDLLEQRMFKGIRSLRKLRLSGEVRRIEFDAFSDLIELVELNISFCGIREISMDALMGVRKLKIFDLSYNNISYIPAGLFEDQNELVEVYLQGNHLRTLTTSLFLLPKLAIARLNENPWKCSCEMTNWNPKTTNQERDLVTESCIRDFQTGAKIACRKMKTFKFNKRLAPRCENYNGRSVFYVLRKQLRCGEGKVLRRSKQQRNHKLIKTRGRNPSHSFKDGLKLKGTSENSNSRMPWQSPRAQKFHPKYKSYNSLDYVLQQHQLQNFEKQPSNHNFEQNKISNEVY